MFGILFDKEKDLNAVKIMTPDHLHGILSMAAMKKGKHVLVHKPLSNRLLEGKRVIAMARNSSVITHLIPWDSNGSMETVMSWINGGAIGTLTEVHNWTNRPVWPQYPTIPVDTPPVPADLTGISGWDPNLTVLIIRIIPIWFSGVGMISAVVPWQIWATIVYGPFSMHYNCRHPLSLNPT